MPRGQKRSLAPKDVEEDPKAKKIANMLKARGVDKSSLDAVAETLRHPLANLSSECREMLLTALPWSICTVVDERHAVQSSVAGMIGEVFDEVRNQMKRQIEAETAKIVEAEGKQSELSTAVDEATKQQAETSKAVQEQRSRLEDLTKALGQKKSTLAEKQRDEKQGNEAMEKLRTDQKMLETVLDDSFAKLKNGSFEEPQEAQALSQKVLAMAPKLQLDESLATALPSVLAKRERQGFDAVVIQQFEESMRAKIASLVTEIQGMEGPAKERESATSEAQAATDAAKAAQEEAAAEVAKLQDASTKACANLEMQRSALSGCAPSVAKATSARDVAKAELEKFCDFNVVAFEMLRDRRTSKDGDESAPNPTLNPTSSS